MKKIIERNYYGLMKKVGTETLKSAKKKSLFIYSRYLDIRATHNKWIEDKNLIVGILVFSELHASLNIILNLSASIISENEKLFNNGYYDNYIFILIVSSYFTNGMYKDSHDLIEKYLAIYLGIFIISFGFFIK